MRLDIQLKHSQTDLYKLFLERLRLFMSSRFVLFTSYYAKA